MSTADFSLSVVIIGRNQGSYLASCLDSIKRMRWKGAIEIIYIDTASTDDSIARAKGAGAVTLRIDPPRPSAAIARNVGWKIAQYPYILFLDGDTLIDRHFVEKAMPFFASPAVAVVCGHRRERFPSASIYQRVLDLDWIYPTGETAFCGGDAIMRKEALEKAKGYDGSLIAGEEPELCQRLKKMGYKILRLDLPMTLHDLNIHSFSQYWKRCYRTGYAYAAVASCSSQAERLWRLESLHNLCKGSFLIIVAIASLAALPWALWPLVLTLFLFSTAAVRSALTAHQKSPSWKTALSYGIHAHFQHLPMFFGQIAYFLNRHRSLIEYH